MTEALSLMESRTEAPAATALSFILSRQRPRSLGGVKSTDVTSMKQTALGGILRLQRWSK